MSQAVTETKTSVSLTINGVATEVPAGTTILQAARKNGVNVPTLCYLAKMRSIGSCRVCSVEVEGVASPVMSCVTPVAEGMVVYTDTQKIKEFRKNMIEFILVNHPTDCPVCERSGECTLQNLTMQFGIQKPRWKTTEHKKVPVVDWGLIRYDRNLCVMCERCIVICREIQGVAAYKIDGTGNASRINTVTGGKLDCDFCGQCISVCPVGALSSGMYFAARSWEVERTQTICPHCAVGCTFQYNTKKGNIIRVTSRDSAGNNKGNLCARGRFGYEFVQSQERIKTPLLKKGEGFVATDWDTALDFIAHKLEKYKGGAAGGLGSERGTNEDNYAFQKFFRGALGSGKLDNLANMAAPDTASGLFENFGDISMSLTFKEIRQGECFVYIGMDGSNENPVLSNVVREAIQSKGADVAIMYSKDATFLPPSKLKLSYDHSKMTQTVLALLGGVVENIKAEGAFQGAAPVAPEFIQKSSGWAQGADAGLKDGLGELVKLLRKKGNPVFFVGLEAQCHPQSKAIVRNVANLAKLTGGKVMLMREYCNSQGVNDMGVAPNMLPGYTRESRPELKSDKGLFDQVESGAVKALMIADEDALRRYADHAKLRSALDKAEFVVVMDHFYTETAMAADVILPTCTAAEKDGTFTNIEGRVQKVKRSIDPVGGSKPVWKIMAELAKRMGSDHGHSSHADVAAEIAAKVPMYGDMEKEACFARYLEKVKPTPELKVAEQGHSGNGAMRILPDHSIFALGVYTDYCPSLSPLAGRHYSDLRVGGRPSVEMNGEDAAKFGCADGDTVSFKHPKKEWSAVVKVNNGVKAGSLRVPEEIDRFASLKLVVNGKEVECVNYLGAGR